MTHRSLPLLVDTFRNRTIKRSQITQKWLREHGIVVPAGQEPDEAIRAAGYAIQDQAQLSIPSTAVVPGPSGTTPRERALSLLRKRKLVIGFDFKTKVCQPFAVHIVPPFTKLDEHFITGGDDLGDDGLPRKPLTASDRAALANKLWFGRVSVLTETAKMGCYSWNMPAGPPNLGGTCPSAALGFMYSESKDAQRQGGNVLGEPPASLPAKSAYRLDAARSPIDYGTFICNGCYALKGNYANGNQIVMMVVRQVLAQSLLKGAGSHSAAGVYFVDGDVYHRARERGAKPDDAVVAAFQAGEAREITCGGDHGVGALAWLFKTAIQCADIHSTATRSRVAGFDFEASSYAAVRAFYERQLALATSEAERAGKKAKPSEKAREQTEKAYAWAIPEPGYFRIHDAGDFYSLAYWQAWEQAMRELPGTRFWAPNRTWAHASHTVDHGAIPENLAMRPSALHFGDPPPTGETMRRVRLPIWQAGKGGGLAAGSGSGDPEAMRVVPGTPFREFVSAPGEAFWECPAYAYWTKGGGAVFGTQDRPAGGTCILARGPQNEKGCRVCWGGSRGEYAPVGVVYHKH
jgi:hypothetical protein